MSCNCNADQTKPEIKKAEQSEPGFFASLFGLRCGEPDLVTETANKCPDCGEEKCTCNFALKSHLKECCGLGQIPELLDCNKLDSIKKCKKKAISKVNPDCPASLESLAKSGSGKCQVKRECPPKADTDANCVDIKWPTIKEENCLPAGTPQGEVSDCMGAKAIKNCAPPDPPQEEVIMCLPLEEEKPEEKCPPMPEADITVSIPSWICPANGLSKTYPAPAGIVVSPISVGARAATLRVTSECESEFEIVCQALQVEDEQIRHHRDVFNPTLLIRGDGYMCPIFKVNCAGAEEEEECDCEDCVAERSGGCRRADPIARECIHELAKQLREENCDQGLPDFVTPDKVFSDFTCHIEEPCIDEGEGDTPVPLEEIECPEDSMLVEEEDDIVDVYPYDESIDEECPEGYYEEDEEFYEYPPEEAIEDCGCGHEE